MSLVFVPPQQKQKGPPPNQNTIQKMLDENNHLIQTIIDYQNSGKAQECMQYQQMLHRNLVYLATIADANQNVQALLPAPGQGSQPQGVVPQQAPQMTQMRPPMSMQNSMSQGGPMQGGNQMSQAGQGVPPTSTQPGFTGPMGTPQQSGPSSFPNRPPNQSQPPNPQQGKGGMMQQGQTMPSQNGSMGNQSFNMQSQQPPGGYPNQQQQQTMMSQPQPMMSQPQPMMSQQQTMLSQQQPMMSQQQPMMTQGQMVASSGSPMMNSQSGAQSNPMMAGPRGQMPPASYHRPPQVRRDSRGHFLSPEDEHDECPTCLTCSQTNTCEICVSWTPERWEDMRGRQEQSRRRRERKAADKASRSNTTKEPNNGVTSSKISSNHTPPPTNGEIPLPVAVNKSTTERVERPVTWTQPIAPCPPIQPQPVFTVGPAIQPAPGPRGLPPATVQWSATLLPAPGTTILPHTAARLLPGTQHATTGPICQLPGPGSTPAAL